MARIILPLLIIIALISCKQKGGSQHESGIESYKDSLTQKLIEIHKAGHINGFSVAIVNQEEVQYQAGIGFSNINSKESYTENTLQNIGSVSKTFIGIALLKAQEMGKLKLDDPINTYLPFQVYNPHHPRQEITLRQLATHTSGILDTDYYDEKSYILKESIEVPDSIIAMSENFNLPSSALPLLPFLEKLLSTKGEWYEVEGFLKNKLGEIYEYTNVGAALAAAVLEIATGKSYKAFAKAHILEPLDMSSSGFSFDDIDMSKHSRLYARPHVELPHYSLITYPDGGLITSISDMAKYLQELIKAYAGKGTILQKNSYNELFKEQLSAEHIPDQDDEGDPYDDEYNTGIFMGFTPKGFIGHTGGDPGIATFMFFKPESKTGKILMINTSVRGSEGVKQFYDIWYTLDEYEKKMNQGELGAKNGTN
ncbi:MAG: serine hydrolase domain-containing protein [Bacteroidota bacterium]